MDLRKKTVLIICFTTIGLVLILYASFGTLLIGSFANLEKEIAQQNIEHALSAISDDISQLNSTVGDWSQWDDTYNFIKDANEKYIDVNLDYSTLANLRVNLILFIDSSGKPVYSTVSDLKDDGLMPVPPDLLKCILEKGTLTHESGTNISSGIILLPEGPLMIVSRPILPSSGKGPAGGTLIMGRYFNSEIKHIAGLIHTPITTYQLNDSNASDDFKAVQASLSNENNITIRPLNTEYVSSYALLKDIYGIPCIILRTDMSRNIYHQGQRTISYFILIALIIGLIFGLAILILLEKAVLSRLSRLGLSISNISSSGNLSDRVLIDGTDELSDLSRNINRMLLKLEQSQCELLKSEERYRAIVEDQTELICRFLPDGTLTFANSAYCRYFSKNIEDLIGHKFLSSH